MDQNKSQADATGRLDNVPLRFVQELQREQVGRLSQRDHLGKSSRGPMLTINGSRTSIGSKGSGGNRNASAFSIDKNYVREKLNILDVKNGAVPQTPRKMGTSGLSRAASGTASSFPDNIAQSTVVEDDNIDVDMDTLDPYLLSLSQTRFRFDVFLTELFYHVFMPLAYIAAYFICGRDYVRYKTLLNNHSFLGKNSILQWSMTIMFIATNALYLTAPPAYLTLQEMILFNVLVLIRHMIVATKFAFVSEVEYEEMSYTDESLKMRQERQVITGWRIPSPHLVDTQLLLASVRCGADLTVARFSLEPKQLEERTNSQQHFANAGIVHELEEKYKGDKGDKGDASVPKVSVRDTAVLDEANVPETAMREADIGDKKLPMFLTAWDLARQTITLSHQHGVPMPVSIFLALCHVVLPWIVRAVEGKPVFGGNDAVAYSLAVMMFMQGVFMMFSNYSFLLIGIMDFKRRGFLQERLEALLADGYIRHPQADEQDPDEIALLHIDMRRPENIISWWYLRHVLEDYGLAYFKRIEAYVSYFGFYVVLLLITLIYQVAVYGVEMNWLLITLIIFHVVVLSTIIVLIAFAGIKVNEVRASHAAGIVKLKLNIETRLSKLANHASEQRLTVLQRQRLQDQVASLQQSATLLLTVFEAVIVDNRIRAVTILGFEADHNLLKGIAALLAATFTTVVRLFSIQT